MKINASVVREYQQDPRKAIQMLEDLNKNKSSVIVKSRQIGNSTLQGWAIQMFEYYDRLSQAQQEFAEKHKLRHSWFEPSIVSTPADPGPSNWKQEYLFTVPEYASSREEAEAASIPINKNYRKAMFCWPENLSNPCCEIMLGEPQECTWPTMKVEDEYIDEWATEFEVEA